MKIDVLTLFPEMFRPVMESSMLGRAVAAGILQIKATDIRQFSHDKHNKADDYPFGGGGGMVMMADPVFGAMESVEAENKKVIYMSPRGKILDQREDRRTFEDPGDGHSMRPLRRSGSEGAGSLECRGDLHW